MRYFLILLLATTLGIAPVAAQNEVRLSVNDIAWSPDGKLLAVASTYGVAVYDITIEGMPLLWSVDLSANGIAEVVVFSPLSGIVAAGTRRQSGPFAGMVYVWRSRGGLITSFQGNESGVYTLAFDPNPSRNWLAVGGGEWWIPIYGHIRVWDIEHGYEITSLRINGGGGIIDAMAYSPDGRWFAYSSEHGAITLVDVPTWTAVSAIYDATDRIQFDPTESPVSRLWLGENRAEEWEFRTTPEFHLVQVNRREGPPPFNGSNEASVIGSTVEHRVTATNDGVLRVEVIGTSGSQATHVDEGMRFTKAFFNPDETMVALIRNVNDGSFPYGTRSDEVAIWTLASGEYQILDLSN